MRRAPVRWTVFVLTLTILAFSVGARASDMTRPTILGTEHMVACGHWLAAYTGNRILDMGGNAFDAGVAMVLAQSVLEFNLFGFGGEAPTLIYVADEGKVYSIDGNMASPKSVDFDWFIENDIIAIPGDGLLPAGVPALLDAVILVLDRWGTMSFAQVAEDAYRYAAEGFPMYNSFLSSIKSMERRFRSEWPSSAEVFLPGGRVPEYGEIFVQKDLANTIAKLIETEAEALAAGATRSEALKAVRDRFYKGDIAEAIVKFQAENAFMDDTGIAHTGNLTMEDFITYSAKLRDPWMVEYKGYEVYKCGPWTQGPVFLQQLNLLENFDLQALGYNTADYWHVIIETAKLAHADKDRYYGDPDFFYVPKEGLLSKEYARERAKLISMDTARNEHTPGDPFPWDSAGAVSSVLNPAASTRNVAAAPRLADEAAEYASLHIHDTTGTRAVDKYGNMFSATPSGGWFTSSPIIPGLGFVLGTRGQMFHLTDPDAPTAYRPGARPCTTLTPTLVLKDGKPFAVFGTPGGDTQDQYTLQTFLNVVEFGMEVQSAIDAPKAVSYNFPSLFYPYTQRLGAMAVNVGVPQEVVDELIRRGHNASYLGGTFSDATTMIMIHPETGVLHGGASPARDKQYVIGR
ncbi:MAG: gamma-glutamyltransferase [Bacillota bacterium]|jgi:gamma-glutamyltranspeptidase/glutathione hydrolase|nr:gamma-glutamyltransferase family protein [Bacillota bacterium]